MKRSAILSSAIAVLILALGPLLASAGASILLAHNGATDPSTEGFSPISYGFGFPTVAPVANDQGLPAWTMTAQSVSQQGHYQASPFSSAQQSEIATGGFSLTTVARVMQRNAPVNDVIGAIITNRQVGLDDIIYGISLDSDGNGNTTVALETGVLSGNGDGSVNGPATTAITLSGNGFHTYELVESPTTGLADLYVDGVDRIQGYAGWNYGDGGNLKPEFDCFSGGEVDYNRVEVDSPASVPEPASLSLLALGTVGLLVRGRRAAH